MASTQRVLVTGADGFIGSALCPALTEAGILVHSAVRRADRANRQPEAPTFEVGNISEATDWTAALHGIDCVVHLVSPTDIEDAGAGERRKHFHDVNVIGSRRLATQAAEVGIRRLVFVSTIKVNGEASRGAAFTETDVPRPEDAYGTSKWESEQELLRISAETGLEVVILRPPLVYGPGVKGNFPRLMTLVARGWPLPFATVRNHRSMIYLGNLVDAILTCIRAPSAAGQIYLVSDGSDISTPELVRAIANTLGVSPRPFPFPPSLLMLGATMIGKREEARRLLGSLQIDSSRIRRELGWRPPYTMEQGLAETARWFLNSVNGKR